MFVFNFRQKKAYRLTISFSLYYKQTQICELYFRNNLPRILKGSFFFVCFDVTPYPASDSILLIGCYKDENPQTWGCPLSERFSNP